MQNAQTECDSIIFHHRSTALNPLLAQNMLGFSAVTYFMLEINGEPLQASVVARWSKSVELRMLGDVVNVGVDLPE